MPPETDSLGALEYIKIAENMQRKKHTRPGQSLRRNIIIIIHKRTPGSGAFTKNVYTSVILSLARSLTHSTRAYILFSFPG
jgi:hypothetical protein